MEQSYQYILLQVLNIKPISAETVVSAIAAPLMFNKKIKLTSGTLILFINFVIKTPSVKK
jgi:hypothetical protein